MISEINDVASFFYSRYKGENSFKLLARIRQYYVGISKHKIQSFINKNCEQCLHNPIFSNRENLKPVIATKPKERCQIDLVIFEKNPSENEHGNVYKYVLSCLKVFSRYVFLRRMKSKSTIEVANLLKKIFLTFGCPNILQCDRGSEFQGIRFHFFSILLSLFLSTKTQECL